MALNPLSKELNRTGYGYQMTTGHSKTAKRQLIGHLLYMDDLKLHGRNSDQLDGLLQTVRAFSDDEVWSGQMCCCTLCQRQAIWTQLWSDGRKNGHHQLFGIWNRVKSTSTWV